MEIEIFEEEGENTLTLDEKYADFTIDIYPESKTYQSRMSLKDDVYYRTEQYEYRIKNDPVKVEIRLTERMDEPPLEYKVKDGVVLESVIAEKNKFLGKDFIDGLKKDVEWHEDWVGSPVSMYILSKHPEIISNDDYRRYLRQLSENIKAATRKIENILKSDTTGLKIIESEYGKEIWYPMEIAEKLEGKEFEKAQEHIETLRASLFNQESEQYVGISEGEFKSDTQVLKYIEVFLNKKDKPLVKEAQGDKVSFGVKFAAFFIQWIWLFIVVSVALWLLSLIVVIIQYNFAFALVASGLLAFFLNVLKNK